MAPQVASGETASANKRAAEHAAKALAEQAAELKALVEHADEAAAASAAEVRAATEHAEKAAAELRAAQLAAFQNEKQVTLGGGSWHFEALKPPLASLPRYPLYKLTLQ